MGCVNPIVDTVAVGEGEVGDESPLIPCMALGDDTEPIDLEGRQVRCVVEWAKHTAQG